MNRRSFQALFNAVFGCCLVTILLPFICFDILEVDPAVDWTMRFFALPILVLMLPACSFMYLKFIRARETRNYRSKALTGLRTIFRILSLTVCLTLIFVGTTLSLILLTNAWPGGSRIVHLNARVAGYHTSSSKGRTHHYVQIQDSGLHRPVELQVQRPYAVGDPFEATVEIGRWGLLYARN